MRMFTFRVDHPQNPFMKSRSLADDAEAVDYARQLLKDWPDCAAIEILEAGELVDRLRPPSA